MPVSPQDFALWSNLTGNPYPRTPAERMAIAPQVHMFNQDLARGRNPLMQAAEGVGKAIDVAGRAALGLGLLTGAGLIAGHYLGSRPSSDKLVLDDEVSVPPPEGALQTPSAQRRTTADNYNQDVVTNQTDLAQALRGTSPGKPTVVDSEEKPATQSQVIASSSTFSPGSELEQLATKEVPYTPVRDRADELIAEFLGGVSAEQRQQAQIQKGLDVYSAGVAGKGERALKDILKEGRQEGISPIGQGSVRGVEAFRQSPEYMEMMRSAGASMEPERLVGAPGSSSAFSEVRPTPSTRVPSESPVEKDSPIAEMSSKPAVDVGSALQSKGLSLSGDEDEIRVISRHGHEFLIDHPYSSHPKAGIRQTALEEEQTARTLLDSAGVSPEQVKQYWTSKMSTPTPVEVASQPSVIAGASPETIALARKAFGHLPIDQAVSMLTKKEAPGIVIKQPTETRVSSGVSDVTEKLLRQAKSMRTSREEAGGMISQEIPTGPIHNISVSPANEVAVTYKTKAGSQTYNFDADPKYVNELVDRIQRGSFIKGQDSAGGFINAGRSMGLLQ